MLRLGWLLPELLLRRGDEAEIVFGVLVVVFGRDRIAGASALARKLDVFFGDVRSGSADLDVRPVGLVNPGHRVLAAPVIVVVVVIVVVPAPHPLVVLAVSHVVPFSADSASLVV